MKRGLLKVLLILALTLVVMSVASAQEGVAGRIDGRGLPESVAAMKLDQPLNVDAALDFSLLGAEGDQEVIVRLVTPSIAEQGARGNKARIAKQALAREQASLMDEIMALDPNAQILAEVKVVLNAIFVKVDAAVLADVAALPSVSRVAPVADYELDLSETVPYIGGTAAQAMGYDGSGVKVAVLDSGIDYFHAALGGSGDPAEYAANDPDIIEDGTFPTAKVVGGYDFVGSAWPGGALAPDPDPLDDGPEAGHGTHVAHIIGGMGGVAPGADLYAVKVCSSVSTSCSGIAMIQGMEFAVDPDGNGEPSDHLDVVNMSLGSVYGQPFDDDMSMAVDNATAVGVLTVASAGNSADKPYITGSPAAAPTALSVAQTQVPSAGLQFITVDGVDYPAVFQPWSAPLTSVVSGPVMYGDGAGGNLNGCAAFTTDLSGYIVLVDRGACNFTLKIKNIGAAGGEAGIIGLVAPGAPFSGGDGDDRPIDIPGYMISQADSNAIKAQIGNPGDGVIDPDNTLPLVGQMVGSSSRGPSNNYQQIKPEIGAPGASVSAIAGTGDEEGPFGGTSGAAPMVSGSAALLLQAEPNLSPAESKARLMNTGETDIDIDPFLGLAEISRIGGGEVRVDRAVAAEVSAWDDAALSGGLSFGFADVEKDTVTMHKKVRIRNYSDHDILYEIHSTFRFEDDMLSGAVSLDAPRQVRVKAGRDAIVPVKLTVHGAMLPGNYMNSGSQGANPAALSANEFDGYLMFTPARGAEGPEIHMPWHVLPRQAANVVGRTNLNFHDGVDVVDLTNNGVGTAQLDAYAWIAYSENMPEGARGTQSPTPDIRAVGVNTIPVPAGFCSGSDSFLWLFAVNTWERQSHLVPVTHWIDLDTNQDGANDYAILNRDFSGPNTLSDGRQLAWVLNYSTNRLSAFFYAEHSMNTGNTIFIICGEQIGMNATNFFQNVDVRVRATDFYFGGPGDMVEDITIAPLGEQYFGVPADDIPGKSYGEMAVIDFGPLPGNTPELGVMLVTNGDRGTGARGGATQDTEAILFHAP